jgi:hypothetical protein
MDCFNSQSYPAAKACAHETHGSLFAFVRIRSGGPEISKSGFWVLGPGCWVPTDAQYSACWCFWYLRLAPPLAAGHHSLREAPAMPLSCGLRRSCYSAAPVRGRGASRWRVEWRDGRWCSVAGARPPGRAADRARTPARTPPAPVARARSSRRVACAVAPDVRRWSRTAPPRRSRRPSARRSRRRATGCWRRNWPPASRAPAVRLGREPPVRGRGAHDGPRQRRDPTDGRSSGGLTPEAMAAARRADTPELSA